MIYFEYVLVILISYFIGNISFARIISRLKHDDITKHGSGNPGSMNMVRSFGIKYGVLTLIGDMLKGVIPSLCAYFIFGGAGNAPQSTIMLYVAGLSVIIGHIYPVIYKFKGGKGIACTLGVFAVANPMWLGIFFLIGFLCLWFFDYGAVASLLIVSALTIIEGMKANGNIVISLLLFGIFASTWYAHRTNIYRLLVGKENKVNFQKQVRKKLNKENKNQ